MRISNAITVIIFICLQLPLFAGKINIRVTPADRSGKLEVGTKFYIEVEAINCQGNWKLPQNFGGAELLYTPSQNSSSVTTADNYSSVSTTKDEITFILVAKKAGTYSFGPVSVGNTKCKPVKYTIAEKGKGKTGAGVSSTSGNVGDSPNEMKLQNTDKPQFIGKGNEDMFLRASVSKTKVYEQEALVYTIRLFNTFSYIKFLGATTAPKFDGFVVEETKIRDAMPHFEQVNGKTYKVAEVARYIIFPQKSGKLTITGNTYTISADAFEYYHDRDFDRMTVKRPVQLNITPNDLVVDVISLPEPVPSDFSGAVGSFSISSSLPDRDIKTNKASDLVYTVSGRGNLKYLKLPDLKKLFPSNIEIFTPEAEADTHVDGDNIEGKVTFTCSFIPMETGELTIPAINFVYFDPSTTSYRTITASGFNLKVGKGSSSEKSQVALRFDKSIEKTADSNIIKDRKLLVRSFSYWLWFIVPAVALIIILISYRRYLNEHSDLELLKSKRAAKIAKKRLRRAYQCLKKQDADSFYNEMLIALWGFLSDKLKMPTSELSRENVMQVLTDNNIFVENAEKVIGLIDKCEFAKYAPSLSKEDMSKIYQEGVNIIETLNTYFKS